MSIPELARPETPPVPRARSTAATVSLVTGLIATLSNLVWIVAAAVPSEGGFSGLGMLVMSLAVSRVIAAACAITAIVSGAKALRGPTGRAKAGAGVAFGVAALLELVWLLLSLVLTQLV